MLCEACEQADATETVDEHEEDAPPYRLCVPCSRRLVGRALRPREWFRLAARHGPFSSFLHDDFYDDDGTAAQPEIPVEDAALHPFPTRDDWERDAGLAFDVAIASWRLDPALAAVLRAHPGATLARLDALETVTLRREALEIAAALGPRAADWMRRCWETERIPSVLAHASVACLPYEEAVDRILRMADASPRETRARDWPALAALCDTRVLDLIERHASSPVAESFGQLAAANHLDWPRVVRWLASGRPMRLVALDALMELVRPETQHRPARGTGLDSPPTRVELERALDAVLDADDVPRVQRCVAYVRARMD